MIKVARRRLSGLLGRLAFRINPDPPQSFSIKQRIALDYPDLADLISGHIVGHGVASRAFKPGSGTDATY